jgi:predicted RNase H-like HicB family nuclease
VVPFLRKKFNVASAPHADVADLRPLTSDICPRPSDIRPPPCFVSSSAIRFRMMKQFTLEYWTDDGWFVGRVKEMPAVMSQGETLDDLKAMIRDAYRLIVEDAAESAFVPSETQEMTISL